MLDKCKWHARSFTLNFLFTRIVLFIWSSFGSALRTFATLLQQEIGWFDRTENNAGRLSKLLENDAATIQTVSVHYHSVLSMSVTP
jgi:hypothetical protein